MRLCVVSIIDDNIFKGDLIRNLKLIHILKFLRALSAGCAHDIKYGVRLTAHLKLIIILGLVYENQNANIVTNMSTLNICILKLAIHINTYSIF